MKKVLFPGLLGEMAKHGETQRTIAKLLEKTPQSISKKFNGRSQWSISEVDKICEHYNKDYYELFKKKD